MFYYFCLLKKLPEFHNHPINLLFTEKSPLQLFYTSSPPNLSWPILLRFLFPMLHRNISVTDTNSFLVVQFNSYFLAPILFISSFDILDYSLNLETLSSLGFWNIFFRFYFYLLTILSQSPLLVFPMFLTSRLNVWGPQYSFLWPLLSLCLDDQFIFMPKKIKYLQIYISMLELNTQLTCYSLLLPAHEYLKFNL